jgi:hypothetical protein
MTDIRDFSSTSLPSPTHVHYDIEANRSHHDDPVQTSPPARHSFQSTDDLQGPNTAPILKRRQTRSSTVRTLRAANLYPTRPQWQPGQEPGLDPSKPNGGRSEKPTPHEECEITVVDYSEDDMMMRHLDNKTLVDWVANDSAKDEWVKCRWINVNGLSWDVIQTLGGWKKLHRLSLEDMLNTKNRTKADWYVWLNMTGEWY